METSDVVQAFRQLKLNRPRSEALDGLLAELTPYEWRHLRAKLNTRTFRFDIVGRLPVELVAQIFNHLDTACPYRLQRVSKHWQHLLRSAVVLGKSLEAWEGRPVAGRYHSALTQKAKAIHRFRTGVYVRQLNPSWTSASVRHETRAIVDALVEDTFVWLSPDRRMVNVCNLVTMAESNLCGDAREKVTNVALSDQLIAFATTLNTCYITDLAGGNRTKFRLGQGMFQQLTCRDRIVASGGFVNNRAVIYIWDFDTQTGKSFDIRMQDLPFGQNVREEDVTSTVLGRDIALLLNPRMKIISVFSSNQGIQVSTATSNKSSGSIRYSRFDFDGKRLHDNEFSLPDTSISALYLRGFHPAGCRGQFALTALALYAKDANRHTPYRNRIRFLFEEKIDKFKRMPNSVVCFPGRLVWWNDTFFELISSGREEHNPKYRLVARTGIRFRDKVEPQLWSDPEPNERNILHAPRLWLNDKYAILLHMTANTEADSHVFFFDR